MIRGKQSVLNGLILSGERPLHPLVAQYLAHIGCDVHYDNGYVIVNGNFKLPRKIELFAQLIAISKDNFGEVIFDLKPVVNKKQSHSFENNPFITTTTEYRSFEVVDKNPDQKARISSIPYKNFPQELVDLFFIQYLLNYDAVVYLGANNEICYMAGDEPLEETTLIADAQMFFALAATKMQIRQGQTPSDAAAAANIQYLNIDEINPLLDTLLNIKYFLIKNGAVIISEDGFNVFGGTFPEDPDIREQEIQEFKIAELTKLIKKGVLFVPEDESPVAEPEVQTAVPEVQTAVPEVQPAVPTVTTEPEGMFTSFINWIWGSSSNDAQSEPNKKAAPRPKL